MSNVLDSTGLSRLVGNIKNKFQPKRLHCELWDDGGDWTITFRDTMEEAVIETEYAKIFDRIKNNENNLIFDVLSNGIEVINNHYNVDYEISYSSNTRIIIEFNFIEGHVDYDTEYNTPIKISLDIDKDENCGQIFIFKGEEHTNITQLSKVNYINTNGNGTKFLANDGSYYDTSKLITFKAENGSLDAKQKEDIDEGYNRNLPMYVLYSGIKMLVNSIQKLGDVWSLSCRHEGVVYSVTVDTAEMSYNVITNV